MDFGWIVVLILGMIYIGMVIPNQQRLKALEEFDEQMKKLAKELGVKSGTKE